MKISLKLANGSTLEFEGDKAEFERVSQFLAEPPDSLAAKPTGGSSSPAASPEVVPAGGPLDPAVVTARLEQVGADNDQERVTVMAQLALEAGKEAIDYETLTNLYTELALKKP